MIDALPHGADCGGEWLEWAARLAGKIASGYEPSDSEMTLLARTLNEFSIHDPFQETQR